jgi:hypothetical protein
MASVSASTLFTLNLRRAAGAAVSVGAGDTVAGRVVSAAGALVGVDEAGAEDTGGLGV